AVLRSRSPEPALRAAVDATALRAATQCRWPLSARHPAGLVNSEGGVAPLPKPPPRSDVSRLLLSARRRIHSCERQEVDHSEILRVARPCRKSRCEVRLTGDVGVRIG